jgi:DNA-binding transcriptional MerR regulator
MDYSKDVQMSRSTSAAPSEEPAPRRRVRLSGLLTEQELQEIERTAPDGLTSRQIVDFFTSRGIRFSEATLRKYVQLGLLPRSVRVGQKGKHQGSRGLYPSNVVRRVNLVKGMMAENLTIEEIQRSFLRFKEEIDAIEKGLRELIASFEREAKGPAMDPVRRRDLEREIIEAKRTAGELVRKISSLESRLSSPDAGAPGPAVGGGSDLF